MKMGFSRGIIVALTVAALGACARDPVAWSDIRYSLAGTATNSMKGNPTADEPADSSEQTPLPIPDSAACRASIRLARAAKSFYAVWWSVRRDSSAWLLTSRSDDGGAWAHPVAADTTDADKHGCARPASSIAADLVSGYVHLAYFLEPASGAGVFAIHSMDRDSSFHSPVAMVYGARPSNTSIAAEDDRVVVVYEDPNSARPQIFIALSRTMGHLFELRLPVSDENGIATDPSVRLRGTKLEVTWTERSSADSARERHASRTGTWK
jgi:hypothetical protein